MTRAKHALHMTHHETSDNYNDYGRSNKIKKRSNYINSCLDDIELHGTSYLLDK